MLIESPRRLAVLAAAIALVTVPATAAVSPSPSSSGSGAPAADASVEAYDGLPTAIQHFQDEAGEDVSFAEAIELGKLVGEHQASTLGDGLAVDLPTIEHDSPSAAVLALADQHDATLADDDLDQVRELDTLDEPFRTELTDVIDAFLVLGAASTDSDPGSVFAARNGLLDEVQDLHRAVQTTPGMPADTASACEPLVIETPDNPIVGSVGVLALDVEGCDATYTEDVRLSIDVGGEDTYHNNAGGTSNLVAIPGVYRLNPAALVDLGDGDDEYGDPAIFDDPTGKRRGGVNGGAVHSGVGALLDEGGNDTYVGTASGVNGGANFGGHGFLLDADGDDTYLADGAGTNGGVAFGGSGALLDADGHDTYTAGSDGTNGGGLAGAGLLVDLDGNDRYEATVTAVNGHATDGNYDSLVTDQYVPVGVGLLYDGNGTDTYEDFEGGTGTDKTVVPKGLVGAQLDHDRPTPGGTSP